MRYIGQTGAGAGAIYIGKNKIVGVDVANGRYDGTYTETNGRIKGTATMWLPNGGALVTGQQLPAGAKLQLSVDWPTNFANGQPQQISVNGRAVSVMFEKIGDVP
jgi:hypothetical protein